MVKTTNQLSIKGVPCQDENTFRSALGLHGAGPMGSDLGLPSHAQPVASWVTLGHPVSKLAITILIILRPSYNNMCV
jgi:hypothetical protein